LDRAVIGDVGLKGPPDADGSVEIHFGLIPAYRGQGCGTEAVQALISWAFTQPQVRLITAVCDHDNAASIRVLKKLGMRRVRVEGRSLRWYLSAGIRMLKKTGEPSVGVKVPSLVWHLSRSRYAEHTQRGGG
ncbi:MAG: GNAT family N-acetyltransferase, partial [Gaiellaceae bacterium]